MRSIAFRRPTTSARVAAAILFAPAALAAQSGPPVAYVALHHTPIGILPPLVSTTMLGGTKTGVSVALRYGSLAKSEDNNKTRSFAGTVSWAPTPRASLSVSAGEYHEICPDPECSSKFMYDVTADYRLASLPLGDGAAGPLLTVTGRGAIGSGARQFDARSTAWQLSAPIALVIPLGPELRIAPYVVPGYAWAHVSSTFVSPGGGGPGTFGFSGNRGTIGGGIDLSSRSGGFAIQIGAMDVPLQGGRTVIGAGLALRP